MADPVTAKPPAPLAPNVVEKFPEKGVNRMYHVGLTEDAPFDYITVPTIAIKQGDGYTRGKCVEVPKRTAEVRMGPNNILQHNEGVVEGRYEELLDIEVEYFLKYIDTHLFRRTSTYTVKDPKTQADIQRWRADIEPITPEVGGMRSLHDADEVKGEGLANYVYIQVSELDRNGKVVRRGACPTIAQLRKEGKFNLPMWPKKEADKK